MFLDCFNSTSDFLASFCRRYDKFTATHVSGHGVKALNLFTPSESYNTDLNDATSDLKVGDFVGYGTRLSRLWMMFS